MAVFSKPVRLPTVSQAKQRPVLLALFVILLLRSRIGALGKGAVQTVLYRGKGKQKQKKLDAEETLRVLQQVYEEDPSHPERKVLLVPYRGKIVKVPLRPTPLEKLENDKKHFPLLPAQTKSKPNIDAAFLKQLGSILTRIVLPPSRWKGEGTSPLWKSKEVALIVVHSSFLVLRTYLSILVARLDGRIVRDLVRADGRGFLKGLALWFLLAIPSTYTNSMIRHLQSLLSLSLRTRLTRYVHDLYLSSYPDLRYYRVSSQQSEDDSKPTAGLDGVEQYITADVEAWAAALSGIYGNVLKPSLDLLLFNYQLSRVLLFVNYYATVALLRAVTPAFGRLAAVEAKLEGEYRRGMGRVGRESEEIAFYNGGYRERDILTKAYMQLIKHVNSIYKIRLAYEWTEDYVIKYLWSAAGYALIAVPILFTRVKRSLGVESGKDIALAKAVVDEAIAGRTETYISNRRLLLSLADAGGRLMYAYKDLLELAGLTTRVYTLVSTLHQLPPLPDSIEIEGKEGSDERECIKLTNVSVRVPSGDDASESDLVSNLNLLIQPGEHLMITGSNGVGKSAVARVLAGLWPAFGSDASIYRPANTVEMENNRPRQTLFVVPQRSYMVTGSLLENIIYPDTYSDFLRSGKSEDDLQVILESVFLGYLKEREGGFTTRKEWRDVLSGGEKQRLGLARECTSAVSSDAAKSLGITLITISLAAEERLSVDREIQLLEKKLAEVEQWEGRVVELEKLLADTSSVADSEAISETDSAVAVSVTESMLEA
ncbi:ATP-binding cassette transporter [Coprinopsis sp. MPI-PUGE-AT-0042]|nr:ATP-binding cassette transporter [Coprinopsis sp. MPI-PUGE-AT-0042]